MITELTPTMAIVSGNGKKLRERCEWVIAMHKNRLKRYDLRDDVRANLEHEVELYEQKLNEL